MTIILMILLAITLGLVIWLILKINKLSANPQNEQFERLERTSKEDARNLRQELEQSLHLFNQTITQSVLNQLNQINTNNNTQLEKMRQTVDEKLQTTLEKRIGESFNVVSERLEKVHQGLGEMQNLAMDVGGLKRVLTNVKTRGTWGEIQLGALLEQMLSPDQYIKNASIKSGTTEVVEYAVKLPDGDVLIPIDSKFPVESFDRLVDASEKADLAAIDAASKELENVLKLQAKTISEKYIFPPKTTNFAIMFLPTESLYAEIMKRPGLANTIQTKYRISITGPSTLGAFLNSLQMGFRTLAIQKRSGEVWEVLSEAKREFEIYAGWVDNVKSKLEAVAKLLDAAGTRTRSINRKLQNVESNISIENQQVNNTNLIDTLK